MEVSGELTLSSSIQKTNNNKDIKLIIVGDSGTGKTSLVNQYILNKFSQTYQATIASQFSYKIIKIDNITYRLQFWDLAGQDKSPSATRLFCQNANGIIFCCEVNRKQTRENIKKWKESIDNNINTNEIPTIIMENKCDLLGKNENDYNEHMDSLKTMCKEIKIRNCFRTSALNGYGVEKAMDYLLRQIINGFNGNEEENGRDTVTLESTRKIRRRDKICCV